MLTTRYPSMGGGSTWRHFFHFLASKKEQERERGMSMLRPGTLAAIVRSCVDSGDGCAAVQGLGFRV